MENKMKLLKYIIVSFLLYPVMVNAHGGRTDMKGCHNNSRTGLYHCHDGSSSNKSGFHEDFYNSALAKLINGVTEVTYSFTYKKIGNLNYSGSIRIDITTDKYVIEGGKDKRSSLDSIQQAVFASTITGKLLAVAIYDTDNTWGVYEHRIKKACDKLNIKFIWFSGGNIKLETMK